MAIYPDAIPDNANYPDRADDSDWIYAARYNELKNEVLAALAELGVLPKGDSASVRARLDSIGPEEGTWTPTLLCGTSGTITLNAVSNACSYTKIGRVVTIVGVAYVDSVSSPVGALTMGGLPFANHAGSGWGAQTAVSIFATGLETTGATVMQGFIDGGASVITIEHYAAGGSAVAAADIKAGSAIRIETTYFTN